MATSFGDYEPVIGLEVHAQLLTRTKAFCACETSFGDPPNTHTCPVCLGLPGALPVLNREAVRMAVSAALALGCSIRPSSVFARKNYFYPDLPKGYQISQYDLPLAEHGALEIETEAGKKRPRILRVHMEEDAGKNLHGVGGDSIIDLNRAGTPLIEIVGEPDLRSPAEAADYLKRLRDVLMFIGVNDGNLEQGSFRCDANVSVRKLGDEKLGTRVELKNINSFRFVAEAIEVEVRRQIALIEQGERVRQQTRGYNADKKETYLLRDKENEAGYRYFPEPDLPPLVVDEAFVADTARALPPLPAEHRRRMVEELGLTAYAAGVLTGHPKIAAFFSEAARLYPDPIKLGNFIQAEVLRDVRTAGLDAAFLITPAQVASILALVDKGTISGKQAKELYSAVAGTTRAPEEVARERGMAVVSDEATLEALVRAIIAANPKQVTAYRGGKTALLGFFVGQVMKQTGGSASPAVLNGVLKRLLDEGSAAPAPAPAPKPAPKVEDPSAVPTLPRPPNAPPDVMKAVDAMRAATGKSPAAGSAPPVGITEAKDPSPLARSVPPMQNTLTSAETPVLPAVAPTPAPPVETAIPYDTFAKLDIRAGTIVEAARVPRKDKLLDLRVDVGDADGPRRVVAGLALSYRPEELIGLTVLVLCNLEPRVFASDLVSQGMILAAGPSEDLALTTITKAVPPGTRIK